ncbi:MAG: 2-amino-4-hydroxy-6-hydroxymethyldihydropteridine diphosphokinase [Gemmatimonadaceae bacterium]
MDDVAFVGLGSNLGDRAAHLAAARDRVSGIPGTKIIAVSAIEETEPIGPALQGRYLNQMIALQTSLDPAQLLAELHRVEQLGGRARTVHWGPRTIDLDIVKYASTTWSSPELQVPHREIDNREFWRRELAELAEVMI